MREGGCGRWKKYWQGCYSEGRKKKAEKELRKEKIAEMRQKKNTLADKLSFVKKEEKDLTQKVYIDMTGTQEEMNRLRNLPERRKLLQEQIKELEEKIVALQDVYKSEVEKNLVESGVIKEIHLAKTMTPETVDELERTLKHLKNTYGVMLEAVIYKPLKVADATATYDWFDDTIYLSNLFSDTEKYMETIRKSERSLMEFRRHHKTLDKAKKQLEEAEQILSDKAIKGFEREKARLASVNAQVELNIKRMAVRENLMDVFTHEYGHFIHRHANVDYAQKKNVFRAKDIGGSMVGNDWYYDINKKYSTAAKIEASKISKYAAEDPYETFTEGFLAMEKGEEIPERIRDIIEDAKIHAGVKKSVAKGTGSGIIKASSKVRQINRSKIIRHGIEEKIPVFDNGELRKAYITRKVKRKDGFYDVVMHGEAQTVEFFGERIDHGTLAHIIKNREDYDGSPVRLLSCHTGLADGKGECIAQRLADELGVIVEAPNSYLNILPDGSLNVGNDPFKPEGEMKIFYPRKKVAP